MTPAQSQKPSDGRGEAAGSPGGSRANRLPPWGVWVPTAEPATRQARAEHEAELETQRRDAKALLAQLEDYRQHWPEMAKDFETLHAAGIRAARTLTGAA